jgi:hypothetical protein
MGNFEKQNEFEREKYVAPGDPLVLRVYSLLQSLPLQLPLGSL